MSDLRGLLENLRNSKVSAFNINSVRAAGEKAYVLMGSVISEIETLKKRVAELESKLNDRAGR